jgi:hypothetical protein
VAATGEHDRPVAPDQQRGLQRPELDKLAHHVQVRRHQRERLRLAALAQPQPLDRLLVARQAGQMEPSDPLDRDDPAAAQQGGHLVERVRQPRPAGGAGVGLGVKAAVRGIGVLGRARGAHREGGHRRQRPVVGHPADDREPRSAVGTVDERVAVAPVGRVAQLAQARVAGRDVGRDRRRGVGRHDRDE